MSTAQATKQEDIIDLNIQGLAGYIRHNCIGWEYHGKWASHTGYYSAYSIGNVEAPCAIAEAHQRYEQESRYPYLVGEEGKVYGWKTIALDPLSRVRVRIPSWSDSVIKQALKAVGLTLTDEVNCYWAFAPEVTLEQGREVLAPLSAPGTRFADEQVLARALIEHYQHSGLKANTDQLTLF